MCQIAVLCMCQQDGSGGKKKCNPLKLQHLFPENLSWWIIIKCVCHHRGLSQSHTKTKKKNKKKKELTAATLIKPATSVVPQGTTRKMLNAKMLEWPGRALGGQSVPVLLLPCFPFVTVYAIFINQSALSGTNYLQTHTLILTFLPPQAPLNWTILQSSPANPQRIIPAIRGWHSECWNIPITYRRRYQVWTKAKPLHPSPLQVPCSGATPPLL